MQAFFFKLQPDINYNSLTNHYINASPFFQSTNGQIMKSLTNESTFFKLQTDINNNTLTNGGMNASIFFKLRTDI